MPDPTISVVLASYNHAPYLRASIASALSQTRPPDEVIVIDDGSTDGSREILDCYRDRAKVVQQENRGTYATLNAGIALATGDWIGIHNSDDVWLPGKLERQMEITRRRPDVGLVHTGVSYMDTDGTVLPNPPGADLSSNHWPESMDMLAENLRGNPVVISSVLVLRALWEHVGGFDERFLGMGDWDFCVRASQLQPFGFADAPLTLVRKHAASAGMDPARLPVTWIDQDWRLMARGSLSRAADEVYDRALSERIPRAAAAYALACLGTMSSSGHEVALGRHALLLAARLQPARWQTWLRYAVSFLPIRLRQKVR